MENLDQCLDAIDQLGCKLDSVLTENTSIIAQQLTSHLLLEPNNNDNNSHFPEKPESMSNVCLFSIQQIENGFVTAFLKQHFDKPSNMKQTLDQLRTHLNHLNLLDSMVAKLAPEADLILKNKKYCFNGYRTLMKINQIAVRDLHLLLKSPKKASFQKLKCKLYRIKLMVFINIIQLSFKEESDRCGHNPNEPNLFHPDTGLMVMDLFEAAIPYLGEYYCEHVVFFLPPKIRKLFRMSGLFTAIAYRIPISLLFPLNKKKMHFLASKSLHNPNMRWPLSVIATADDIWFRKLAINLYHLKTPSKSTTYFIPKQQQWTLRSLEDVMNDQNQSRFVYKDTGSSGDAAWNHRKVIKCNKFGNKSGFVRIRVLRHRHAKPDGSVLFHCHGGMRIYN